VKIGRFGDVDIKLLDSKVSREHARIEIEGSQCRITDLNSSNGTYINGRRLSGSTELKDGDEIKLGDTFFVLDQRPV
jgi:pSer/pThr/pTyr-binding forkhead associated (FHA) protein